jgi:hypothetical protein
MAEDGAWGFGKGRRRISIEVRWLWLLVHCARAQQESVLSRSLLLCTCLECAARKRTLSLVAPVHVSGMVVLC